MEKFLRFKTRKWRRQFVFFRRCHRWVSGATVVVMSETPSSIKYNICFFLSSGVFIIHLDIVREIESSSPFFVGFKVVVEETYTSGLWQSRYILNLQYISAFFSLLTVVFLALWFVNFVLTVVKASTTSYGYFHYVSYGIFAHWFSLNQMFKFSVSFATEVERNRPSHRCFNRGLCSTKDLKRATGHLSPPNKEWRDLKSLLLSCYHVIMFI